MISPLAALIRYHEMKTVSDEASATPSRASDEFRLLQSIPADLQKKYLRISKRHGTTAVVTIERGVCMGCFVRQASAPSEVEEDIYECQNCNRLLYDPDVAYDFSAH